MPSGDPICRHGRYLNICSICCSGFAGYESVPMIHEAFNWRPDLPIAKQLADAKVKIEEQRLQIEKLMRNQRTADDVLRSLGYKRYGLATPVTKRGVVRGHGHTPDTSPNPTGRLLADPSRQAK